MKFVCGRVFSLVSKTNKGGNLLNPYLLPVFLSIPFNKLPWPKQRPFLTRPQMLLPNLSPNKRKELIKVRLIFVSKIIFYGNNHIYQINYQLNPTNPKIISRNLMSVLICSTQKNLVYNLFIRWNDESWNYEFGFRKSVRLRFFLINVFKH